MKSLIDILPDRFKAELNEAEKRVLVAAQEGRAENFTETEEITQPQNPESWGAERTIRAGLLVWLCTDKQAVELVHAKGVQITGAKISGWLNFIFSTLPHPLVLSGCSLEGIDLMHAEACYLNFGYSIIKSITADGLKTKGSVFLRNVTAHGEVRLIGANIGGMLDCTGAAFNNAHDTAFCADVLKIKANVFLNGITAHGEVRLLGADIRGELNCTGAIFNNGDVSAFCLENATIKGALFMNEFKEKPKGLLDLMHARVGQLVDDKESWPETGKLLLDGFAYNSLPRISLLSAKDRLEWLRLQPTANHKGESVFFSQPYEHLASVYRKMGLESHAREILVAKHEDLRKHGDLNWPFKLWNRILGITIGHGYKTYNAIGLLLAALTVSWAVYTFAGCQGIMVPAKERIYLVEHYNSKKNIPLQYPTFSAFWYSLDVLVPLVDLHQDSYWLPDSNAPGGCAVRVFFWLEILWGWFFSTLAVASLTGLVRKD